MPGHLAQICKENDATVVYISTGTLVVLVDIHYFLTQKVPCNIDYVFDGRNPPYNPGNEANPLQEYGVTKFAGEKAILGVNGAAVVVLRVPVL